MRSVHIVVAVVTAMQPVAAGAIDSGSAPRVETHDPAAAVCPADDRPCLDWLAFRRRTAGPYQSLAIAAHGDRATVIISEAPAMRDELLSLADAVFADVVVSRVFRRWSTGLDGWLEDLVLDVRVEDADTAPVVSGHDLAVWQAPAGLVDRLLFLHSAFQDTTDGFYVDDVGRFGSEGEERPSIAELEVRPAELFEWLTDPAQQWLPLAGGAPADFATLSRSAQAAAHRRSDGTLVALAIPPKSSLASVAAPFRRFAVDSDLLLGAFEADGGTVFLIGRARQLPMTTLPPLRFETFASFVLHRTTELAQSYERQRIFAGRIQDGPFTGWDWAPILLSSQLDDSEFGTLLNQADQILKSWSQAGTVDYHSFAHKKPDTFPFGEQPASDYFGQKLGTTSLVFNWNTEGLTSIHQLSRGSVLTPDRYGALPILYMPTGNLLEALGLDSSDPKAALLLKILSGDEDPDQLSRDAALAARTYFADRGDPILVRVLQNVLLYQSAQAFLDGMAAPVAAGEARWFAVSRILLQEAKSWLREASGRAATDGDTGTGEPSFQQMIKGSGLSLDQLAEMIATPQVTARRLAAVGARYQRALAAARAAIEHEPALRAEYDAAFAAFCTAVHGTVRTRPMPGEDGQEYCQYPSTSELLGGDARARLGRAETALKGLLADAERTYAELEDSQAEIERLQGVYRRADELAGVVRREAAFGAQLDRVLDHIRAGVRNESASATIRTPAVVLSRSADGEGAIGGHNVDFRPAVFRVADPKAPALRKPADTFGITTPPTRMTLAQFKGSTGPAEEAASKLKATRSGSLLEEMRAVTRRTIDPEVSATVAREAGACACDAVVVRTAEGEVFFASNLPPPGHRRLLGTTGVVDALAGPPRHSVVSFRGFTDATVENLARSTSPVREAAPVGRFERFTRAASALFGRSGEGEVSLLLLSGRHSSAARVRMADGGVPVGPTLKQTVKWREAQVSRSVPETSPVGATGTSVTVVFPSRPADPVVLEKVHIAVERPGQAAVPAPRLEQMVRTTLAQVPPQSSTVSGGLVALMDAIKARMTDAEISFLLERGIVRAAEQNRSSAHDVALP